jgi:hypothetical protein
MNGCRQLSRPRIELPPTHLMVPSMLSPEFSSRNTTIIGCMISSANYSTNLSRSGLRPLDDFLRFNEAADLDHARKSAVDAMLSFQKAGNHAGELLARFDSSYADQLAHQVSSCHAEATRARDGPRVRVCCPALSERTSARSRRSRVLIH